MEIANTLEKLRPRSNVEPGFGILLYPEFGKNPGNPKQLCRNLLRTLLAFVSLFVSRALKKGAKSVQIGPLRQKNKAPKVIAVQGVPRKSKKTFMISSQVPLTTQPPFHSLIIKNL